MKINGRNCAACDTDDLLVALRAERETRERHRNRDALLQNEIRTQQQKKSEQESEIDQPDQQNPPEVIICCSAEFQDSNALMFSGLNDATNEAVAKGPAVLQSLAPSRQVVGN